MRFILLLLETNNINMKKQITYSSFINRIFASTIDVTIFSLLTLPITSIFGKYIFWYCFGEYLSRNGIDVRNYDAAFQFLIEQYQAGTLGAEVWDNGLTYFTLAMINNLITMGICYLGCWFKWGNTPGKALLKLKIVDEESMNTPSRLQFIKRYFGYIFSVFNIILMPFDQRLRGTQDIIAGTVVIKS
ncbi:MAG: hypothetical protein K0Q51_814 [Rickettsiaceae bacterium]|nr:hypothetical protein [Rickettsiaceae bacterium]